MIIIESEQKAIRKYFAISKRINCQYLHTNILVSLLSLHPFRTSVNRERKKDHKTQKYLKNMHKCSITIEIFNIKVRPLKAAHKTCLYLSAE